MLHESSRLARGARYSRVRLRRRTDRPDCAGAWGHPLGRLSRFHQFSGPVWVLNSNLIAQNSFRLFTTACSGLSVTEACGLEQSKGADENQTNSPAAWRFDDTIRLWRHSSRRRLHRLLGCRAQLCTAPQPVFNRGDFPDSAGARLDREHSYHDARSALGLASHRASRIFPVILCCMAPLRIFADFRHGPCFEDADGSLLRIA